MTKVELFLEGRPKSLSPAAMREGGEAWVPLSSFATLVSCVAKEVGDGRHSVCREGEDELCVLLGVDDTQDANGIVYGRLGSFAEALDLQWQFGDDDVLHVGQGAPTMRLGIGDRPPEICLFDADSGELVSSEDVLEKPAVFYMWASW